VKRGALFVVVSLSGASVLVLEILGTRVLGPFYGVSLFLWSALIGVTLAALAAGYAIGGRWAGPAPRPGKLAILLAIAGLWVLAIPLLRAPVLALASGFGLRGAVVAAATLLFFPPLMLLGMVSPFAIRLATRHVDEVGRVSGDLFAISTVASVVAAILTGFVLIPQLGVTRLLGAVAAALFLAAAVVAGGRAARTGAAALAVLAGFGAGGALERLRPPVPGVLAREESAYGEIRVVEHKGLRYLLLDGGAHSIVNAGTGAPRQSYVHVAESATELFPRPGRMLLLGLGGGGAAQVFARRQWQVDAVEIDARVVAAAREWFHLLPQHARVIVGEGRQYLQSTPESYDVVFFDAFGSAAIPFHLVTREAFAAARRRLLDGGVLVVNVETVGWDDPLAHALAATMGEVFSHVVVLPTAEPPDALGNIILMASDRPLDPPRERLGDPVATLPDDDEHFAVLSRLHAWDNRYLPRHGRVLTDDWNPVDLRAEEINRAARRWLQIALPESLRSG
jgi:spermidine synthase